MQDLVDNSADGVLKMSPRMQETFDFFHRFMYSDVYTNSVAKSEENKVEGMQRAREEAERAEERWKEI